MRWVLRQNLWWGEEEWVVKDPHLRRWDEQRIKWIPEWLKDVSLKPFSLNFVYGIRQMGKTTGVKLLIKYLIQKEKVDPFSIFFFDFELVDSLAEFRRIIEFYFEVRKKEKVDSSFIFLDEVSSITEWWKVVKFLIDLGEFENDVVTVLGSSSINLLKAPERFPGRRGKGRDVAVLPLTFPEFLKVHGKKPERMLYNHEELKILWEKYTRTGGFPRAINSHEDALESFIAGAVSEVRKHQKSLEITQGIVYSLMSKIPSAMSYHSIAKEVEISHKTVREYVEFLEDLFVLKVVYQKNGRVWRKKEKKIFFRDPFILRSLSLWTGREFLESALYEGIVQEHLLRKFGEIYYQRNAYEIDCVAGDLKVEVKAGKPHRRYPRGVKLLDKEEIPLFLIELFLNH